MATKGYIETETDIGELIRKSEEDFNAGEVKHSKYVSISLKEDIDKIYAYLNSKHTSGEQDALGRDKPFLNVVIGARNIWFRATDIDRSLIKIRAKKSEDDTGAMLATVHLQDWMIREDFGTFLNTWGLNSASFNESVVKFVEKDGRLIPSVIPWTKIICDPIDFANNPKIEVLELTEAQLKRNKAYDKEIVKKLCDALTTRETIGGEKKDNKANYIKLYEIHGELPLSYLTGNDEDDDTYTQQMHVVSFVEGKSKGEFDDYTLYSGKEEKDPYMLTALLPEVDGSIGMNGAVKNLFTVQWMENHSAKQIKDQLDAALTLFQTSDTSFSAQNVLANLVNGDILIHKVNEPLTLLNNRVDTTPHQAQSAQWKAAGNEIVGISDAMLGVAPKSGTAWRQTEALLQENHSLFELMTENRGLDIERMCRTYIIPFLKKRMNSTKEVSATLSAHQIEKIDSIYIKNVAVEQTNEIIKRKLLSGEKVTPEDQATMMEAVAGQTQDALSQNGNQRFFKPSDIDDRTWKEVFKDLEWDVVVDVTNESLDPNALATLQTLLQIVTDPVRAESLKTGNGKLVFNKLLELTNTVNPVELVDTKPTPPQPPKDELKASMNYKDTPADIQRQIEAKAGLQPSSITQPKVEPDLAPKQ